MDFVRRTLRRRPEKSERLRIAGVSGCAECGRRASVSPYRPAPCCAACRDGGRTVVLRHCRRAPESPPPAPFSGGRSGLPGGGALSTGRMPPPLRRCRAESLFGVRVRPRLSGAACGGVFGCRPVFGKLRAGSVRRRPGALSEKRFGFAARAILPRRRICPAPDDFTPAGTDTDRGDFSFSGSCRSRRGFSPETAGAGSFRGPESGRRSGRYGGLSPTDQ